MTHPKVDWSKAPAEAVAWSAYQFGKTRGACWHWFTRVQNPSESYWMEDSEEAPLFGYRGTVENSLTLRPPKRKKMSKADRLRLEHGMTA